jgi:Domain of unknown function (DUF4185)
MPEKNPPKKVSTQSRTSAGSKGATPQGSAKRPPPALKSGAVALQPAVLTSFVQAMALPQLPQPPRGQAWPLGVIAGTNGAGPGPTSWLGAGAVDLCEISPSGQVALGGDNFAGNAAYDGTWSPSIGLHVRPGTVNSNLIQFDSSFGQNGSLYAEPCWPGGSQLPAGTVQVFNNEYALVTRTVNLQPLNSRLVQINPNGPYWPTVPGSQRDADWQDGNETQISGYQADDNWVYIVADGFARDHTVRLYHCHPATFTDRNTWWAWGVRDGQWQWDVDPAPLSNDRFGELSLRLIEGKSVLSGFNVETGQVEVRVADDPTQVLAPGIPMTVVADQNSVPRNYGGYIVPGSTLDQAIILVSQWASNNNPYNVQQFVVNLNR